MNQYRSELYDLAQIVAPMVDDERQNRGLLLYSFTIHEGRHFQGDVDLEEGELPDGELESRMFSISSSGTVVVYPTLRRECVREPEGYVREPCWDVQSYKDGKKAEIYPQAPPFRLIYTDASSFIDNWCLQNDIFGNDWQTLVKKGLGSDSKSSRFTIRIECFQRADELRTYSEADLPDSSIRLFSHQTNQEIAEKIRDHLVRLVICLGKQVILPSKPKRIKK